MLTYYLFLRNEQQNFVLSTDQGYVWIM